MTNHPPQPNTAIDVESIERELNRLWAEMTALSSKEDERAVMRACFMNLVVYAAKEKQASQVSEIIGQVTRDQPGRVIVVMPPAAEDAADSLTAQVTAQCHSAGKGEQQICCEQILVGGPATQRSRLPSLIQPLLVPDLPVFLLWGLAPNGEDPILERMVRNSDRVIIDSALLAPGLEALGKLSGWIQERVGSTSFSDMSWCLLTPWRSLVASFFDRSECLPCLSGVDEVKIEWEGSGEVPAQALLVGAWLASRLGWRITGPPEWDDPQVMAWNLAADLGPVRISFQPSPDGQASGEVLRQVRLSSGGSLGDYFEVAVHADGQHLETHSDVEGRSLTSRLVQLDGRSEAELLAKELEILRHDKVYEQALGFLSQLADVGRFS